MADWPVFVGVAQDVRRSPLRECSDVKLCEFGAVFHSADDEVVSCVECPGEVAGDAFAASGHIRASARRSTWARSLVVVGRKWSILVVREGGRLGSKPDFFANAVVVVVISFEVVAGLIGVCLDVRMIVVAGVLGHYVVGCIRSVWC